MTDEDAGQPVTRGDANRLTAAVEGLSAKFKWQQRLTAGLIVAFVGVCVALGLGALALVQVRHENACVASLAAASADRTGSLAPLNNAKNAAADAQSDASSNLLFHAITTFGESPAQRAAVLKPDTEAFTAAHEAYIAARDAYNRAYAAEPPPAPHKYAC
jgi:hypothetical protein